MIIFAQKKNNTQQIYTIFVYIVSVQYIYKMLDKQTMCDKGQINFQAWKLWINNKITRQNH